jgi:cytochrome b561
MENTSPKFPPLFRLWHWLMAFSIFGLLFTVLLRKTFLSKSANAEIIQSKLASLSVTIDPDQALAVAKAIRAPMWEWHYIFAAVLGISIALRIILMIAGQAQMPLLKVLRSEGGMEKFKATIHLLLCLTIALLAVTGAVYYFFESDAIHWVKTVHEKLLLPLMILVVLHIVGVVKHELSTKECLVSKMIHGAEVRC